MSRTPHPDGVSLSYENKDGQPKCDSMFARHRWVGWAAALGAAINRCHQSARLHNSSRQYGVAEISLQVLCCAVLCCTL